MFDWRTLLAMTVATSLAIANVTAAKIAAFEIPIFGLAAVPAGFVGIGVAFLATDLLSEVYGKEAAREAVNGAIMVLGIAWALIYASVLMPAAPFYGLAAEYNVVMGQGAAIVLASIMTLLVSQNVDVSVFHAIKRHVPYKWARNCGSTAVSQAVDTVLFIALAFVVLPPLFGGSAMAWSAAGALVIAQYVVKLAVVGLDTPLFYLGSVLLNRDGDVGRSRVEPSD